MTPNPDIFCNKYIKFGAFFQYAKENLRADAIATGHYARTTFGTFLENFNPNESKKITFQHYFLHLCYLHSNSPTSSLASVSDVKLLQAVDSRKDQTFFLSQIPQNALRNTMFPVGEMMKSEVKKLASEIGLDSIAQKRESTGICFIGKRKFSDFLAEYVTPMPGDFVDMDTGEIVGQHNGIHNYTIGQNISLGGQKEKLFVLRKMKDKKTILVAPGTNNPRLYCNLFFTEHPHWIDKSPFNTNSIARVKFRFQHGHKFEICDIAETEKGLIVKLDNPVRAICSGQFAVFYRDNECFGSAKISETGPYVRQKTKKEVEVEEDQLTQATRVRHE